MLRSNRYSYSVDSDKPAGGPAHLTALALVHAGQAQSCSALDRGHLPSAPHARAAWLPHCAHRAMNVAPPERMADSPASCRSRRPVYRDPST